MDASEAEHIRTPNRVRIIIKDCRMSLTSSLIQCSSLSKRFKLDSETLTILRDINLTIKPGKTIAIIGPSGSGKTTLLSVLAGLESHSEGELHLFGMSSLSLTDQQRSDLRLQKMGFVFQDFKLLPHFTAHENVSLPLELLSAENASSRATEWLNKVGLSHRLESFPTTLSGGEKQRVAIARAFITNPKVVFADEPTGNLDAKKAVEITDVLWDHHREQGTSLIIATHDSAVAARCNEQYKLINGKLII